MKLKTLKDLSNDIVLDGDIVPKRANELKKELKREAIKWVKEIRKTRDQGLNLPEPDQIVMSMNNITEKDLQSKEDLK